MHEAGIADRALAALEVAAPPQLRGERPHSLTLRITDPAHVDADAVTLHLEIALMERGWGEVPIEVSVATLVCLRCDAANRPEGLWPFCAACGAPLPEVAGAGIEVTADW